MGCELVRRMCPEPCQLASRVTRSVILGEAVILGEYLEWDDKFVKMRDEWPTASPQNHDAEVDIRTVILSIICPEFIGKVFAVIDIYILGQNTRKLCK